MGVEQITLGILILVLGAYLFVRTGEISIVIGFIILGLGLLWFNRAEETIEKRKDTQKE